MYLVCDLIDERNIPCHLSAVKVFRVFFSAM